MGMHILRIDEMVQYPYTYIVSSADELESNRWIVAVSVGNDDEFSELSDMAYESSMDYEFVVKEWAPRTDIPVLGDTLAFSEFRKMHDEWVSGNGNPLHDYMTSAPAGDILENHMYYSEELRKDVIELSDERLLWRTGDKFDNHVWELECKSALDGLSEKYGTEFYALGRMGRHICVDFTIDNLSAYEDMKSDVESVQKELVQKTGGR